MKLLAFLDFVPFFTLALTQSKNRDAKCRCLYGESCWPTEQDFVALSSQLSQSLIHPVPPASACYPVKNPSGNCSDAQSHRGDSIWRADMPGAYENLNFETYIFKNDSISACYLNTTLGIPCEQGNVPPIGVDARTVEDVQAAVKFASQHNLRVVVKNTGHDYLGRSAGRNAFMIWTHHLKNISYDAEFIPQGGSKADVVPECLTVGAGVQWREAYDAATQNNRFIVGGISPEGSNGAAGGWIMGGGHSAFSPKFGLGVDNAVQFTIVTPNGDHVVANDHQNQDLFWALRGGGAGSWGVVTSATYKTHDNFPIILSVLNVTFPSMEIATNVTTELVKLFPKLSDMGWGGYGALTNTSLQMGYVAPNVSWADANATILPFFEYAINATQDPNALSTTLHFDNFAAILDLISGNGGRKTEVGSLAELASRLLSREAAEQRPEETAKLLLSFDIIGINFVAGGAVARAQPDSVALNPGWRKGVAHVYTAGIWDEGTSAEVIKGIQQSLARAVKALDPISPNSTTYMNEASLYEPDFKKAFFGSHYDQLRDIKRKYDPNSLFVVAEGVASDEWDASLTCPL